MENLGVKELSLCFHAAYHALESQKELVNALNVFPVPDGDTGTNMALTLKSAIKQMDQGTHKNVHDVAKAISSGALMGARGNSGVILSQIFRGFAKGLENATVVDVPALSNAFVEASRSAYKAVMRPTEGTILTVIRNMAEFAERDVDKFTDVKEFAMALLQAGEVSLQQTPDLLPILKEAGVVDAGGKGLLILLQGALDKNGDMPVNFDMETEKFDSNVRAEHTVSGDIKYGYCTEMMILGSGIAVDPLREKLETMGDSLLVVGDEDRVKIHIHTNNPGVVLEEAGALGALTDIKIDNMRQQFENIHGPKIETKQEPVAHEDDVVETPIVAPKQPTKKYGFIAVSSGDGVEEIFTHLGVDEIITGGQTMNPSTEDIFQAIERIDAKTIYILPNNGNIVMASNQAAKLAEKQVIVVPTKTIPQGFAAMMHFDGEKDAKDNEAMMNDALAQVKTAEVTYAVRDTKMNGKAIQKGNFIGIEEDTIHATGKDIQEVVFDLLKETVDEDSSLITVLYGEDTMEKDAEKMAEAIEEKYPEMDVELAYGGQPLYFYIFSIE